MAYSTHNTLLYVENLSVSYGEKTIIKDINFVEKDVVREDNVTGQVIAVVGRSGTGKSTFFRALTGLVKPTTGKILIADTTTGIDNDAKEVSEGDIGDLLTEEEYGAEMYQDYGEDTAPELPPVIQVVEKQERSLARLLLNYGSFELENDILLAQHIIEEIEEIDFKDPVVVKVVQAYKTAIESKEKLPDLHYFLGDEDQSFKDAVTDLVASKHELSERWEDHEIYTPKEEDVLSTTLFKSILRLKWKQIKVLQKENSIKLASASTDDEVMECLQLDMELKKVEMDIAKQVGTVISS